MDEGQARDVAVEQARLPRLALPDSPENAVIAAYDVQRRSLRSLAATTSRLSAARLSAHSERSMTALRRLVEEEVSFGCGFLFIPVLLGAGICVWFSFAETPSPLKIALLLCATGMAAWRLRHDYGLFAMGSKASSLFLVGMLLAHAETVRTKTVVLDTSVTTTVRGEVVGRETTSRGGWRYRVIVLETREPRLKRAPGTAMLLARGKAEPVPVGGVIEGRARLSPPSGPALPGLNDFSFDSYFRGVGAVGYFYGSPKTVSAVSGQATEQTIFSAASGTIARWREAIGARIRGTVGGDAGAIAAALITAEERAISPDTVEVLRQAGLAHVLAISGLNMVLAAGTLLIGLRTVLSAVPGLAHRLPIKKIAAAGALAMVSAYILISGGAVSAVRSWIMISIMLVAVFFDRPSISLRNVALSALIILVVTPSAVTGPGFQMSFAATLALVAGYAGWRERPGREKARPFAKAGRTVELRNFFAGLLLSSMIGSLSTMIYSAGHFNRLAAYGLAGNILAMPIISIFVMPFALIAMLLMPFGLDGPPLAVMGFGLQGMITIARWVASWGGEVRTGRIPDAAFVLIAVGGVLVCLFKTRLACIGLLPVMAGVSVLFLNTASRPDIVISEDGQMVGLIGPSSAATNRTKPPDFIFSQWQRALDLTDHHKPVARDDLVIPDPTEASPATTMPAAPSTDLGRRPRKPPIDVAAARAAMRRGFTGLAPGGFLCAPRQWCAATTKGWRILTVEDARFIGAACDEADLVVTPIPVRLSACLTGARLITGRSLRRSGALEIFLEDKQGADRDPTSGFRVVKSLDHLGRPWSVHRTYDWRTEAFVPQDPVPSGDATDTEKIMTK